MIITISLSEALKNLQLNLLLVNMTKTDFWFVFQAEFSI